MNKLTFIAKDGFFGSRCHLRWPFEAVRNPPGIKPIRVEVQRNFGVIGNAYLVVVDFHHFSFILFILYVYAKVTFMLKLEIVKESRLYRKGTGIQVTGAMENSSNPMILVLHFRLKHNIKSWIWQARIYTRSSCS